MTRSSGSEPVTPFPDPEFIIRSIRKEKCSRSQQTMAARVTLADNTKPSIEGRGGPISYPVIDGASFELKHHIIQLIKENCQFHGLPRDDPNAHIDKFIQTSNSYKQNGVNQDIVRLYLFPYSLTHHALSWFEGLETDSITSWTDMATKFLTKYFPPAKQTKHKNDITNFNQAHDESIYSAWERFKNLLKKCPNHQLEKTTQLCTFYNGLAPNHRITLDAAAQGNFMQCTAEEAWSLIENMTMHHHDWNSDEQHSSSAPLAAYNPIQTEAIKSLTEQIETLAKQIGEMKKSPQHVHQVQACQNCTNPPTEDYQVEYEDPADGTVYYAQFPVRPQNPPGFARTSPPRTRGTQYPPRNNQPPFQPKYPPRYPTYPQPQLTYNQPLSLTAPDAV